MPKYPLFPLIGCALVLTAVGADYGLGQIEVPKPHRLPVEAFPATIGSWQGGAVHEVDPEIQKQLATAKIVERVYTNPSGQSVDLMLLTATEDEDMHSPKACFPAQGWALSDIHATQVNGQPATQMTAQLDGGERQTVLYWLTGYYLPNPPHNALLKKAFVWRSNHMGARNNMSLFVRILAPDTPLGNHALADFTHSLNRPIEALIGTGANPAEKSLLHRKF